MLVRYRYRLDPSPGQRHALARVFGCSRVVYNDCLRLRQQCYAAGEKISDSEVQRRVITMAKVTAERQWLAQAPSVALVQACNDARRAYRNWFDSLSGKRKGRQIGRPVLRRKRRRQSIRLTRNGFSLRGSRLYVPKVGEIRVRWSRSLPRRAVQRHRDPRAGAAITPRSSWIARPRRCRPAPARLASTWG